MAWTAPRTWAADEVLTAALLNSELRDNMLAAHPVGSLHFYVQAATTSVTTINGFALECNAATPTRATYSALNTLLSGLSYPFGSGDGSTTFTLPDLQGRAPHGMSSGGHADVNNIGDSDGVTKANRSPKHNTTNGLSLSGAPGVGTLALPNHAHSVTDNGHTHTLSGGSNINAPAQPPRFQGTSAGEASTPSTNSATTGISVGNPTTLPAISGAPSVGTLAVGGSIGPGGTRPIDQGTFLVAGIWAVKY